MTPRKRHVLLHGLSAPSPCIVRRPALHLMRMDEKTSLHASNYPARRRKRGCFGFLALLLIILFVVTLISRFTFPGMSGVPVFGHSVGVIRIEGPINESKHVVKVLASFRRNPLIRAIVLRLDTPGGAVGASEEISREVARCRKDGKRVIASMGNAAASGGYYIAVAAEELFANSGTLTGSIGVIAMDWNVEEVLRKVGVRPEILKSGEHKDTGSPLRAMSPEDRALLQSVIYDTYRQFFRTVLRARHKQIDAALDTHFAEVADILSTQTTKLDERALERDAFTTGAVAAEVGASVQSETALRAMADGRIFTGDQAHKLGLIDRIGTLEDAIQRAGELAGLGREPATVERRPESSIPALLGAAARAFREEFTRGGTRIEFRSPAQ
jgi:protease IV